MVSVARGAIPDPATFRAPGGLTLIAGILGTTALWPNFFLESRLVREKGWHRAEDVPTMRRDLGIGYAVGGVITVAILIVAAAVLRPAGIERLTVVDMIILFPTFNGIFGLPIAAALLFWAVNDAETMGEHRNTWALNGVNSLLVLLALVLAVLAAQGFIDAVLFGRA